MARAYFYVSVYTHSCLAVTSEPKYHESDWSIFFYLKNFSIFQILDFSLLAPLARFVWVCVCVHFAFLHKYLVCVFHTHFRMNKHVVLGFFRVVFLHFLHD